MHTSSICTERLTLVPIGIEALSAFAAGDEDLAASLLQVSLCTDCHLPAKLAALRLSQLRDDASSSGWLLRAIVASTDSMMVGYIGFHSGPSPAYLRELAPNAVEIGYTIFESYRRNGYAHEAALGLFQWATERHGVREFVASVAPDNAPSLAMLHRLGDSFTITKIGHYDDPDDGPEDIYLLERPA